MKAQRALGLNLSWLRVIVVFLIDVAILVLASNWPGEPQYASYAWWTGVGIAALLTVVALVTHRRVPLSTALGARIRDRFVDSEAVLAEGRTPAVDHRRRYGRELVGLREYRGQLVAVVAVGDRAATPSGRHHRGPASTAALPVELVAAGLRQFDMCLDNVDIVSVETRSIAGDGAAADGGGVPDRRNTWLVLRMDPQRNVTAVAARDSVASTVAAVAERLAQELEGRQISVRVLPAEEFAAVDAAVLAGLEPAQVRAQGWRWKPDEPRRYVTSFWVSPHDIESENLERLWLPEADATVVTIRLTPRQGRTEVSVLVRYHSAERLSKEVRAELNQLRGRWLAAVCTGLPVPLGQDTPVLPARDLHDREHLTVQLESQLLPPVVRAGAPQ